MDIIVKFLRFNEANIIYTIFGGSCLVFTKVLCEARTRIMNGIMF